MDFNYNYFYTGIRCILESNHSILLQLVYFILFRCYQFFINTTISSPKNLFNLWIIILSTMSLINCLCTGINKLELFFIFYLLLKYLKLRLIILKPILKWVLVCIKRGVIIVRLSIRILCTWGKWKRKRRREENLRRRNTIRRWRISCSKREVSTSWWVVLPLNH